MARSVLRQLAISCGYLLTLGGCAPTATPLAVPLDAATTAPVTEAPATLHQITTLDGASLGLKRYPADAAPVLLIHGLALNAESWDCPPLDTPEYSYRSLASTLRDAGFDVWLLNLRGHGNGDWRSRPPPGQSDWSIDHLALYDVPAAVEHIVSATGQKPFAIASSLGAMALAAWLEGVAWDGAAPAEPRLIADPITAAARQSQIAGAVFIAFPAALRWPRSPIDEVDRVVWGSLIAGLLIDSTDANVVFESAAHSPGLQGALELYGSLPLRFLRPNEDIEAFEDQLPPAMQSFLDALDHIGFAAGAEITGTFNGRSAGNLDVVLAARGAVLENVEAGVLRQFASSIRARAFISDLGSPPLIYSDHYATIASPTLLILGGRDRNAHAETTREAFFDVIPATDKTIRIFDTLAHGEFELAPVATTLVYPEILAWLTARESLANVRP